MTTHLTDEELTLACCGEEIPPTAQRHLNSCLTCRRQVEALTRPASARRRSMEAEGPDWQAQKTAVIQTLMAQNGALRRRSNRWIRPSLAAAAVLAIAVLAGQLQGPSGLGSLPTPQPELPVEQIFARTESLLADDSIPGLEVFDDVESADFEALLGDDDMS